MDRPFVLECDDAEELAFEFGHGAPKAKSTRFLSLDPDRRFDDTNAQFLRQVRPLCQHLLLEVLREPVGGHWPRIGQADRLWPMKFELPG